MVGSLWGTEEFITVINPGRADDAEFVRTEARRFRAAATPRNAAAQFRYILENVDVRSVLPLIQAPTLVLHTSHNPLVPIDHGRYLADHIPGAKFVEVPGHGITFDDRGAALVLEEIAEFLTGERPAVEVDRVLTTVLFTDIVASTEHLASLGDRRWSAMLDAHDRAVREQLRRFRGREINTTGDGFAACFDGPGRAIACATSITQAAHALGIEVRAGLHTGECEVRGDDLAGLAVHVAARIGSLAGPGEVLVSTTVKDLVAGSGIEFVDRGEHQLKGIPTAWRLFAVADAALEVLLRRGPSLPNKGRLSAPCQQCGNNPAVPRWIFWTLRSLVTADGPMPHALSRWRHGFESRWGCSLAVPASAVGVTAVVAT